MPILRDFSRNAKWDSVANEVSGGADAVCVRSTIKIPRAKLGVFLWFMPIMVLHELIVCQQKLLLYHFRVKMRCAAFFLAYTFSD